jgi:hypothetical protein
MRRLSRTRSSSGEEQDDRIKNHQEKQYDLSGSDGKRVEDCYSFYQLRDKYPGVQRLVYVDGGPFGPHTTRNSIDT